MAIFNIEPKTSKVTGGVTIDITGNNFSQEAINFVPIAEDVINTSTTQSILENKPSGLSLQIPEILNQRASFRMAQLFPEAFKIKIQYEAVAQSFPVTNNTILVGLELQDASNPSKKIRYYVTYNQS